MKSFRICALLSLLAISAACVSQQQGPKGPPPNDPIASVAASELRAQGLGFARRGDLVRAQQYLSASMAKGFDEGVIVPEIVKVCIASSRLRAALAFAEPYLMRNPEDAGMQYVVGTIHMALGNLQEASAHLDGALRAGSLGEDALFSLALVAEQRGDHEIVRTNLERYLSGSPRGRYASRAKSMLAKLGAGS
jgi:tetratricopeptide (TPR) repeat protein